MDVLCDRCRTEYEFDDALVSDRGTTVKCTNCGHEFKVFRSAAAAVVPERWEIHAASGRELLFHSLRELQKGILAGRVTPDDELSRTGLPTRRLGSIVELRPFFDEANASEAYERVSSVARARMPTPVGLGGSDPPEWSGGSRPAPEARVEGGHDSLAGTGLRAASVEDEGRARGRSASADPRRGDPDESAYLTRSRLAGGSTARFAAAVAVVAAVAGGFFLSRGGGDGRRAAADEATSRAARFVAEGEGALAAGDLEAAKEAFDKASALDETGPRVVLGEARLADLRADIAWLRLRLLEPSGAARADAEREVATLVIRARQAAERALGAAPGDAAVLRVDVDARRMAGDGAAARALAPRLTGTDGETAYVLAALDLADLGTAPPSAMVLGRLRSASALETVAGRAHALYAYAAAEAGQRDEANAAIGALASAAHPHPLVTALRAYVGGPAVGGAAPIALTGASATAATTPVAAPASGAGPNRAGRAAQRGRGESGFVGAGEFSEGDLQKHLFGDGPATAVVPSPAPAGTPPKSTATAKPATTSDSPAVGP